MGKFIDMSGRRFGALTVLRRGENARKGITAWICRCDCGHEWSVRYINLTNGSTTNCGCIRKKAGQLGRHPLSKRWNSMMTRCYNKRSKDYKNYGGRGIAVCKRWHDLASFIADLEPGFIPGLTLERKNNDGPYSPQNCRWASIAEQSRNKRSNRHIKTPWGRMTIADAARRCGIERGVFRSRMTLGWTYNQLFDPSNFRPMSKWNRRGSR